MIARGWLPLTGCAAWVTPSHVQGEGVGEPAVPCLPMWLPLPYSYSPNVEDPLLPEQHCAAFDGVWAAHMGNTLKAP